MKYTFLIIDADKGFRELLHIFLKENYSSNILEASDRKQALSLLKGKLIDLIVMDLTHPKGRGIDLVKEIRLDPKLQYIPIILVTTHANVNENAVPYEYVQGIVEKPFHIDQFIHHVNLVLHENKNPDIALLKMGTETQTLDYKEDLDLSSKVGRASLAKDVIAMANSGGGVLVIGVAERTPGEFEPVGLSEQRLKLFETSLINKAIRGFISPHIAITSRRVHMRSKTFIFIEVPESDYLAMAARQNEEADLYLGRIYSRTHAAESAELHVSADVQKIIDRLVWNQIEGKWRERYHRKRGQEG
jgi:DNA-binding response OmpR family regulator